MASKYIENFLTKITLLPQKICLIAGYLLIGTVLFTTFEVIMRYVFRNPFGFIYEIGGFVFLTLCSFGVSYALVQRKHIGVDIVINLLKPRARSIIDLFCLIVTAGWGTIVFVGTWQRAYLNFKTGNVSPTLEIPLFPLEVQAPIGMLLFVFVAFIMIRGDFKQITKSKAVDETEQKDK